MIKEAVEVNIGQMEEILDRYLDAGSGINYAIKIVGHPGIGKSAIVKQVARNKNHHFIDTRLAFKENIDLGGYPVPDHTEKRMIYYRPKFIPPESVPEEYKGILWFLDEANRAHPTVIQTLFQIITERKCGEHRLPSGTAIVLSGNLGEDDHTSITEFDDSALDGRLAIFHLKPNASDWLSWALEENIHPAVISYISLFPEKLWDEKNINPNPRGWHQVSQAINLSYGLKNEEELSDYFRENQDSSLEKIISSLLCKISAHDFILQHTTPRKITSRDVLDGNPDKLDLLQKDEIPSEDLLWALAGSVSVIREAKIYENKPLTGELRDKLTNLLTFIGVSRADIAISFFYFLIKECGIFTEIPSALKSVKDQALAEELKTRFESFLETD